MKSEPRPQLRLGEYYPVRTILFWLLLLAELASIIRGVWFIFAKNDFLLGAVFIVVSYLLSIVIQRKYAVAAFVGMESQRSSGQTRLPLLNYHRSALRGYLDL
jgi:hypothetical protein